MSSKKNCAISNGNDGIARCAVVGYGPRYNWGWMHSKWIGGVDGLFLVAICDKDPECLSKAEIDYPEVNTYTSLKEMLARDDIDLVSIATQHNTHAPIAVECLSAGKHVVVEKPMCISIAESTGMIDAAKRAGKTLAVFHNRRHDGNVRAIKEVIDQGLIGDVFHIELSVCGYGSPENTWRSQKEVSGGGLYDWGAHAIDWVLHMIPSRMAQVTGFFHKRVWHSASTEDQEQAVILFENGTVANVMRSSIAYIGKPLWYILGTKGAILDTGKGAIEGYLNDLIGPPGGSLKLVTARGERQVEYKESDWVTYYADMANHLRRDAPVPVSGEDGRRVITVLETAEKSSRSGRSEDVPYH